MSRVGRCSRSPRRGSAMVEYLVVTGAALGALLMPFGEDRLSALERLLAAIRQEHAGYLYAASVPALPGGRIAGSAAAAGSGSANEGPAPGGDDATAAGAGDTPATDAGGDSTAGPGDGFPAGGNAGGGSGQTAGGSGDGSAGPIGGDGNPAEWTDDDGDGTAGDTGNGDSSCPLARGDDADTPDDALLSGSLRTGIVAKHVGNPIHVVTGNKYQREVDLHLPRLQLGFVRHYNSRSRHRGALGAGWTHGFDTRLRDDGERIALWQGDGRRIDFDLVRSEDHVRHFLARQHGDGRLSADAGGYQWRWRDGSVLGFDRDRSLRLIRDPRGRQLRLLRDAAGRLTALRNDLGHGLELHYDARGRIASLLDAAGVAARYDYDPDGNLIRVDHPGRPPRRYHYEDPHDRHNLTGISVGDRRTGTWAYDDQDRGIAWQPGDAGRALRLGFGPQLTRVTTADGRVSTYRSQVRDGIPLVTSIEGPACSPCARAGIGGDLAYDYNERLQLRLVRPVHGPARAYEYDARGRLTRVVLTDPDTGARRTRLRVAYRADSDAVEMLAVPSVKPGSEHLLQLEYDEAGRLRSLNESGFSPRSDDSYQSISRRRRFEDQQGTPTPTGGHRTDVDRATRLIRDVRGMPTAVRFPDGGALRVLERDEKGRPHRLQADDQDPLTLSYDVDGRIESVASRRGRLFLGYDRRGRLRSIRKAVRAEAPSTRAARPPGRAGSVSAVLAPAGTTGPAAGMGLGPAGRLATVTDPNGATTRYGTDDFGRHVFTQSPDSGLTTFEYDEEGRLRRTVDASDAQASLRYDAGNRLIESRIAGGQATRFTWSSNGAGPRLSRVDEPDGGSETRDHDEAGRIRKTTIRIGDAHYSTAYEYDRRGRLVTQRLPDGRRLKFRYRDRGAHPDRLRAIVESRWPRDRPLISGLDGATREATLRWTAANGVRTFLVREHGRLARLLIGGLHDFSYRHDDRGRITGIDDRGRPAARYRFDAQGRLDLALTPEALHGYRYDPNGNRVRAVLDGRHTRYTHAERSNRLSRVIAPAQPWLPPMRQTPQTWLDAPAADRRPLPWHPGPDAAVRLAHGAGGAIETLGALQFAYDANGQLVEVRRRGTLVARYRYNSRGQRIAKQTFDARGQPAAARHYLYENGRLAAEADIDGTVRRQYLHLGHRPVALLDADAVYAVHSNHLGAPVAVTDRRRVVVWRARYAPFGRASIDEDPDADGQPFTLNLRLPGQYEDAETGLHYNHHRYYEPDLGRYLSPDPLGLAGGPNPYAYAANDPVNHVDPTGLLLFAFDGTGNSDPPLERRDISNVVRFKDSYLGDTGEPGIRTADGRESDRRAFYIGGPGTRDTRTGIHGDERYDGLTGHSMIDRIAALADDFFDHIAWHHHLAWFDKARQLPPDLAIDVVGFSRGAASARVFANLLTAFLNGADDFVLDHGSGRRYEFTRGDPDFARRYVEDGCLNIELRFMGLFDSVPHYSANQPHLDLAGTSQDDDLRELDLAIPPADAPNAIGHVAHAVAANENRRDFHAISIHPHPLKGNTEARMEMGFIGAHADIGGGYSEGDLSDVAFMWMVQRAEKAGVRMEGGDGGVIRSLGWDVVTSPVIHDSSDAKFIFRDGRNFKYGNDVDVVPQQRWYDNFQDPDAYGMDYSLSQQGFYNQDYRDGPLPMRGTTDFEGNDTLVGLVDGAKYSQWLSDNYGLEITINKSDLDRNGRPIRNRP